MAKCTSVDSTKVSRSASGRRMRATPVRTAWVRPERRSSMWRASSEDRGLPKMWPSRVTSVSAPMTMAGPAARAATSSALATARRSTRTWADSPGYGVSSTADESVVNEKPASRRISARRTDAEARMSFMTILGRNGNNTTARLRRACTSASPRKFIHFADAAYASDDDGLLVFAEHAAKGVGNFADSGVGFDGGEDGRKKILSRASAALEFGERGLGARGVTFGSQGVQSDNLGALHFLVNAQNGNVALLFRDEIVHSNHDLIFFLDGPLELVSGFLDFPLDEAYFNGAQHSSHRIHFFDVFESTLLDFVGERFDGVGARDRVDGVGDAGFVGKNLLRAQSDQRGVLGRQGQRFVHGIGVKGLAAAENGRERLNGHANDVVFRLLRGERRTGGLRVETQHQRARIFRTKTFHHDFRPQAARGAILANFFEQIAVRVEEKRKLRREFIDAEPGV